MNVDHQVKNHFYQLDHGFYVLNDVQESDDFVEPQHPSQLEDSEQLESRVLLVEKHQDDLVHGECGRQIDPKLIREIVACNFLWI